MLTMGESAGGPFVETAWADRLVALGAQAFRYSTDPHRLPPGDQLFVAITVPVRDLAASLIAAGWMMTAPIPRVPSDCRTILQSLELNSTVRMVTNRYVILDEFLGLNGNRLRVGGTFRLDAAIAVARVAANPASRRMETPNPPAFGPYAGKPAEWAQFLCQPPCGLAIIGAKTAILRDLSIWVNAIGRSASPTPLHALVLPREGEVATWATELISASKLSDDIDDAPEFEAVVLDGASAIQSADFVDSPLIIAVVDRSVMDDTAAEFIAQRRNTKGTPIDSNTDLGWQPPRAVEIAAFRTRR